MGPFTPEELKLCLVLDEELSRTWDRSRGGLWGFRKMPPLSEPMRAFIQELAEHHGVTVEYLTEYDIFYLKYSRRSPPA